MNLFLKKNSGGYKKLIIFIEEKVRTLNAVNLDLNVNSFNKVRFFLCKLVFKL
jgi:hypothetical protein